MEPDETFMEKLVILWGRRRLVVGSALLGILAGFAANVLLPKVYESSIVLLARQRPPIFKPMGITAFLGSIPHDLKDFLDQLLPNLELVNPDNVSVNECVAILRSWIVVRAVIDEVDPSTSRGPEELEAKAVRLAEDTAIASKANEPMIRITVRDSDSQTAAFIANSYAKNLSSVLEKTFLERRTQLRTYVERQLQSFRGVHPSPRAAGTGANGADTGADSDSDGRSRLVKNLERLLEYLELESPSDLKAIEVVDPAVASLQEVSPKKWINVFLGMAIGLMAGVFLALFLHNLNASPPEKTLAPG